MTSDSMRMRMTAAPLFSWLAAGAATTLAGLIAVENVGSELIWPPALLVAGVVVAIRSLTVRCAFDEQGIRVRNLLRRANIHWEDVIEVSSGQTGTPLTRASTLGVIIVRWQAPDHERRLRVAATTGLKLDRLDALMALMRAHLPADRMSIRTRHFPTLGAGLRRERAT